MTPDDPSAGAEPSVAPPRHPEGGRDVVSPAAPLPGGNRARTGSNAGPRRQFLRFAGVGALATSVHYLLIVALVESGLAGPVAAKAWGYIAGALVGYAANRRYTFTSRVRHSVGLPRFLLVAAVGFVLNAALMAWMTAGLEIHYLVAQIVATALVLLWNFAANRQWTFGDAGRE